MGSHPKQVAPPNGFVLVPVIPTEAMRSAAHTAGPWEWSGNRLRPVDPDPSVSAVHSILDADGGYGFLGSDIKATLAELVADRLLIAAAPDLLSVAVCEQAYRDGPEIGWPVLRQHGWDESIERDFQFVSRLRRAAILKATGSAA